MKTNNFSVAKLVAVTLMLGFFSPTVTIQEVESTPKMASGTKVDMSQGLLATLSTYELDITLLTQAEAKPKKKYRKARRKARRKATRRAAYRHHRGHHYGHYHDRRDDHRRDVAGALLIGGVVGAALNEATQD